MNLGKELVYFVVLHALELRKETSTRTQSKTWSCVRDNVALFLAIFS